MYHTEDVLLGVRHVYRWI